MISNRKLIADCLAGNVESWDALLSYYQGFLYSLILRAGLNGPDAEDVFQNVCLSLYQNLGSLRDADRLSGWLATAVRQESLRLARRNKLLHPSQLTETSLEIELENQEAFTTGAAAPLSPEESVQALEREYLVRQGLKDLSLPCRELLSMLYFDDPPAQYTDIALQLSMPIGSIGPRRARCLQTLKKKLIDVGF